MGSPGWLERYRRGEREQVWHELRQWGDRVREPDVEPDAQAVCDEMARRARHNVELIVERLREQGYRFHVNDDEETPRDPFIPVTGAAVAVESWLWDRFGRIPLAVSSWLRLVGDVWLVGTHPDWPESAAADPLVIQLEGSHHPAYSIVDYFGDEHEAWQEWSADHRDAPGFVLPVAPDRLHKANISGGGPYGFRLPDGTAEGLFAGEVAMPFVAYLNRVFDNGGFPGHAEGDAQWKARRSLSDSLLPL